MRIITKKMDKIKNILIICFLLLTTLANSQTDKQINKCVKLFKKDYTKGINKLEKYMMKAGRFPSGNAWETLVEMEHLDYLKTKDIYASMDIKIENDAGENLDSLGTAFKDNLISTSENYFIDICRRATLMSNSYGGDYYLRKLKIEEEPDTAVSEKSKEYFEEGFDFFNKKDFELAKFNFKKAIDEDNSYYAATLYLADSFWAEEFYDSSMFYFNQAIQLQPNLIEPRVFLIDALLKKELYVRAKKECIAAICIYPSNDIKVRYQRALKQENKFLNEHKLVRDFFPNDMNNDDQKKIIGFFSPYRDAKNKIGRYCDKDGIIEANGITDDVYLEVYSWRNFLKEQEDELPEYLRFAQKMEKAGYLDCYILTSFFHVDIYPQLKHFMSIPENRERTEEFINKYLIDAYK